MAQQLIVSVNGVIQKPNAGSSQPSEGFAIDGNDIIFSAAPASGSDYFIVTQGSSVSIGTPSDNTVSTAKIQNQAVNDAKILDNAIEEVSLKISNAPSDGKFLQYKDSSDKLTWATVDVTPEGTVVKSTTNGNESSTKFLRADGDGTCSWQVPPVTDISGKANLSGATFTGDVVFDGETANKDITFDRSENWLKFNDETKVVFGTTANTTLFHNGTDLYIQNGAGDIRFEHEGGYPGLWLHRDGAIELYDSHAAGVPQKKLETTATGINVIGQINVDGSPLSAAPEVSLVADGAIAANKPVAIQSDGKIKEIKETITVTDPPTTVPSSTTSTGSFIANESKFNCAVYIPEKKRIVGGWLNWDNQNYPYMKAGKMNSDGTITWGSQVNIDSAATNGWISLAYDPEKDKVLAIYKDGNYDSNTAELVCSAYTLTDSTLTEVFKDKWIDSQDYGFEFLHLIWNKMKKSFFACASWNGYGDRGYMTSFTPNYSAGTITDVNRVRWGPHEEDNSGEHAVKGFDVAQNTSGSEIMFSYVSDGNSDLPFAVYKGIDTDGSHLNSETQHKRVQISTMTSCAYTAIAYDPDNDLYVIAYCEHQGDMKARTLTTSGSGNSITFSLGTEITVNTESSRISMEYDSAVNKFGLRYNGQSDYPYIVYLTVSGTSLSAGTAKQLYNEANNNALDNYSQTVTFDESQGRMYCVFTQGTSNYVNYKTVKSGTSTTTLSDGYIGFSTAAINDTATGTIAVTGNTNSSQSGLTAGSKHYVHRDGSLKTTVDTSVDSSPEAGIALSSTKLLIKG